MNLYGKELSKDDLRRRVGSMDQVAGIRTVQLQDGNEHPMRAALVHTGTGLEFTVLLDRCLDIASASFQGKAMGWRSTTGNVAPQFYEAEGLRWLRSFNGGLVATCGLMNVGAPKDESALLGTGLHGRIGNTPAKDIQIAQEWVDDDYVLRVTGTMRETRVFGENLTLKRTISTKLGSSEFEIHDVLTNEGFSATPFQLLYHCNLGWPAVDIGSEIIAPSRIMAPRDADAADGKEQWGVMDGPTHGYAEKCYFHDMEPDSNGMVTCAVVNSGFERGEVFGVYVSYSKATLPRFTEWKQMGEQDYTLGLEPCNCGVSGRDVDEANGLLHTIEPGEQKEYRLAFGPVTTADQVAALRTACGSTPPKIVDDYFEFVPKPE